MSQISGRDAYTIVALIGLVGLKFALYFLVYKSQQDAHVTEFIFVRELLYVFRGFTITHLQEHKTTVTTASGNRYTVLLSAAIVEELEPV